jgi:hypothetical protein
MRPSWFNDPSLQLLMTDRVLKGYPLSVFLTCEDEGCNLEKTFVM